MAHSNALTATIEEGTNNMGSGDAKHWSLGDAREKISKITSEALDDSSFCLS